MTEIKFLDSFWESLHGLQYPNWWKRLGNRWYKLKCLLWNRFSTVRPRYLPHTWVDRDILLVHVMFEVLCDFVEKEMDQGSTDWEGDESHKAARLEMLSLYEWWTLEYQDIEDAGFQAYEKELAWDALVESNCVRLIKIRGYMWT